MTPPTATAAAWAQVSGARLSRATFQKFSAYLKDACGLMLPDSKATMLEGRLRKRLAANHLTSFEDYLAYIHSPEGDAQEVPILLDIATTHKTHFFRERPHFDLLQTRLLPQIMKQRASLEIWSAGCSSGEEVYTLAMLLDAFKCTHNLSTTVHILGTDISRGILQVAANGVFPAERAADIPQTLRKRYLLKSRDPQKGTIRIVPDLRKQTSFGVFNLISNQRAGTRPWPIIFCRNVLIYFERAMQLDVIGKLRDQLEPGGYLFIGHSESTLNAVAGLEYVAPAVYRRV